jgi:hypothetical protein
MIKIPITSIVVKILINSQYPPGNNMYIIEMPYKAKYVQEAAIVSAHEWNLCALQTRTIAVKNNSSE